MSLLYEEKGKSDSPCGCVALEIFVGLSIIGWFEALRRGDRGWKKRDDHQIVYLIFSSRFNTLLLPSTNNNVNLRTKTNKHIDINR